jgi:sugar lactone lactonase YvrE
MNEFELLPTPRCALNEGPLWDAATACWVWVDIPAGKLLRWQPDEDLLQINDLGEAVGSVFLTSDPAQLLVARKSGLYLFEKESGEMTLLSHAPDMSAEYRYNEGRVDPLGRLWVGSLGGKEPGKLYCFDGRDWTVQVENVRVSNGLVWSEDRTRLYFVDSPTRQISVFALNPQSLAIEKELEPIDLSTVPGVPDGMTRDQQGLLWVAFWGGGGLRVLDPIAGAIVEEISLPAHQVTSCEWGGPEGKDLFVTSADTNVPDEERARRPFGGHTFLYRGNEIKAVEPTCFQLNR